MSEPLGFEAMYAAISGRDVRFDGTFYTAVRTTGVYCRPSCPARKPRRENVTFYRSAAAAQAAGYRACLRCSPEALPGSPWWNIAGSVAARAVQLIDQGVVDDEGVEGLARRLGWSTRTITRVLVEQTGAPPLAHARARRARLAYTLITTTRQPFSEIAFAAGFSSIRQFNDTILTIYGASPTRLRSGRSLRSSGGQPVSGTLRAHLAYRPPLHWESLLGWYAGRALPTVEEVDLPHGGSYRTALELPHGPGSVTLRHDSSGSRIDATLHLSDLRDYGPACSMVRRLLDLDADPTAIDEHLAAIPPLKQLVAHRPGVRIPGTPTPLEALLRALTGQQVTVAAGRTALATLVDSTRAQTPSTPSPENQGLLHPFPAAESFLATGLETFRAPAARRQAMEQALELAAEGSLDPSRDPADITHDLSQIKGIGPWTIAYTMMRGYGQPDVDLSADRALRTALQHLTGDPQPRHLLQDASPWSSYAALHLWHSAPVTPAREASVPDLGATSHPNKSTEPRPCP
ncbi:DNA-3-methyladenine glycosylase 2 family protein [Janibacter indicus]